MSAMDLKPMPADAPTGRQLRAVNTRRQEVAIAGAVAQNRTTLQGSVPEMDGASGQLTHLSRTYTEKSGADDPKENPTTGVAVKSSGGRRKTGPCGRTDPTSIRHSPEADGRFVERPQRPLLRRAAACDYLWRVWGIRRAPATLAKLACIGGGPKFRLAGRWPMYGEDQLDEYARDLLGELIGSTSVQG